MIDEAAERRQGGLRARIEAKEALDGLLVKHRAEFAKESAAVGDSARAKRIWRAELISELEYIVSTIGPMRR